VYDRLRIAAARQRPAKRPGNIEPCIPTLVSKAPEAPQWIYEIKHDGYRLLARRRDDRDVTMRLSIWIGILVGSTIGGMIPLLWGDDMLSYPSVLLSGAGAFAGLWVGFKMSA
jgi:hypothetical protein